MSRESDEWGEKEDHRRIKAVRHVEAAENPFDDLKLDYSVDMDDEECATRLLRKVANGDLNDLRRIADDFLFRLEDAKAATITRFSLGKADRIVLSHICEKAAAEVSALLRQVCELASDDIEDEDVQKASLFFYLSLGTAAEMVCSLVSDELNLN